MDFEKIFNLIGKGTSSFDAFQKEIEEIKENERETGKVILASFKGVPGINTAELTEEDMEIWEQFKINKLSLEKLEEYRNNIDLENYHRRTFSNFIVKKVLDRAEGDEEIKEA
jgi:hypothetical protein